MELRLRIGWPSKKIILLLAGSLVIALALLWFFWLRQAPNTIPASIRNKASFKSVYPSPKLLPASLSPNFSFDASRKAISFSINFQGNNYVVTEQPAPANLATGSQVYFQSLGLHPIAQFNSKVGPVAICNFYQTGSLTSSGQAGLLVSGHTLVIITAPDSNNKPTNEQWQAIFDNFSVAR